MGGIFYFRRFGTAEPLGYFVLAESPLPADFHRRKYPGFRPKADCSRGDSQPFCNCGGGQKWFTVGYFVHKLTRHRKKSSRLEMMNCGEKFG
jgi:hypothetical protein